MHAVVLSWPRRTAPPPLTRRSHGLHCSPEIVRCVSQLNTWPVVSPVNASRRPSRDAAHHSGSGRLARPSPWWTFTSYSLPASWRTRLWVISGRFGSGRPSGSGRDTVEASPSIDVNRLRRAGCLRAGWVGGCPRNPDTDIVEAILVARSIAPLVLSRVVRQ
jgi:hypothetical protein